MDIVLPVFGSQFIDEVTAQHRVERHHFRDVGEPREQAILVETGRVGRGQTASQGVEPLSHVLIGLAATFSRSQPIDPRIPQDVIVTSTWNHQWPLSGLCPPFELEGMHTRTGCHQGRRCRRGDTTTNIGFTPGLLWLWLWSSWANDRVDRAAADQH